MKNQALLLFLLCPMLSFTQQLELCRQVVGSIGGSAIVQGYNLQYTVGEPVIEKLTNPDFILTQGFHQPELCLLVDVTTYEWDENWEIKLYPNPTPGTLQLQWGGTGAIPPHQFWIINAVGQPVLQSRASTQERESSVDCSHLPAGSYFLRLFETDSNRQMSLPFVITNQ